MTHQFLIRFASIEQENDARLKLESLRLGEDQVVGFSHSEPLSLYFGCQLRTKIDVRQFVGSKVDSVGGFCFGDQFYQIEALKSGRHHPDGCLWIQSDNPRVVTEKVSVLDIFPTISALFGAPNDGMHGRALPV